MADATHSKQTVAQGIHISHAFEYANAAARTGAAGLTSADIGKIARQLDDDSFWILQDDSPLTWLELGGGSAGGSSVLIWGDDGIATTTTTRYLTPGYDDGVAETSIAAYRAPRAGTAQSLRVRQNTAGVGAATITYTFEVNGSPTSLAVAMSNTVQDGSDLVNTAAVVAGDLIGIRVTKSAAITTSPDNVVASLELM